MDDRYIAAVDLGSSKIAVSVAKIDGNDIQILYYKEHKSDGIRNSAVQNPGRLINPLKNALDEAENDLKIKIFQVLVGLPRYSVSIQNANAKIERTDSRSCISSEEVEYLKSSAIESYPIDNPDKMEAFGIIAQSFSADDYINGHENDVIGMVSDSLEGNFKIFLGRKKDSNNIETAFGHRVAVAKKLFVPETTARAVLTHEEMDNGVALIEIGGGVSSVTIYKGGIMRHYASIPFGGETVTNDIRTECGSSMKFAENLKKGYGACIPEKLQSLRDKILQIDFKETGITKQLSVAYLSEIITSRITEIIEALLYHIQESGYADKLASGVVVTGGEASLPNLASLISELSGYDVRIGYPRRKYSAINCPYIDETAAATSIGLILAGKEIEHLNCLESAPVLFAEDSYEYTEEAMPEGTDELVSEDDDREISELFNNNEVDASEEEKKRIKAEKEALKAQEKLLKKQKEEEKRLRKQREKEEKRRELENHFGFIKWAKGKISELGDGAGKLLDDFYDNTENNI